MRKTRRTGGMGRPLHTLDFWASIPYGAVIHYDNGFNQFVRGIVVDNPNEGCKGIRPVALVGNWAKNDLPQRRIDGSIYYPHHADGVLNARIFTPSDTCVYEAPAYRKGPGKIDPTKLQPKDLTVQEMTAEESAMARKVSLLFSIREEISQIAIGTDFDVDDIIREVDVRLQAAKDIRSRSRCSLGS